MHEELFMFSCHVSSVEVWFQSRHEHIRKFNESPKYQILWPSI